MGALDDTDAQAGPLWPELEALALPAREKRRLPPDTRSRIILDLCALAPLSVKELSLLLDRSEAYVGDAIRPLVTAGDLSFSYPGQPRHPKQRYRAASRAGAGAGAGGGASAPVGAGAPTPTPTPAPTPAPAPTRAPPPPPAPAPAPAPAQVQVPMGGSAFPNRVTNIVFVVVAGIVLASLGLEATLLYSASGALAVALALAHIIADSSQYEQFRMLHGPRSNGPIPFILLKAGVAAIEIMIIYFVANAVIN